MPQLKDFPENSRAELQRVLESEIFRHSDSLRRLLEYLGEKSLSGANGLKEYTIGVEAFHKPPEYNPQEDPTIRVLASKLRQKLNEYYGREGTGNPVRIEIPRGHYELRFHSPPGENGAITQAPLIATIRHWRLISLALGASALLFLVLGLYWRLSQAPPRPVSSLLGTALTPELEMVWRPFLENGHPIVMSLGTPLFTKLSGCYFRNPSINEWPDALESEQIKLLQKTLKSDYAVPNFPYTGVGEAMGAFLLSRLLQPQKSDLTLKRSHILMWEDFQNKNVIFLGPPKFNQLLKDISSEEGFVIDRGAIRNLNPRSGEQEVYRSTWSNDHTLLLEDYSLIYRLPGMHDRGEMMMLGSASTEATWAAVEYVTQPTYAKEIVSKLKMPSGRLPRSFQVVIRVEMKQQVPWKISYAAHRVIEHPWKPGPPVR